MNARLARPLLIVVVLLGVTLAAGVGSGAIATPDTASVAPATVTAAAGVVRPALLGSAPMATPTPAPIPRMPAEPSPEPERADAPVVDATPELNPGPLPSFEGPIRLRIPALGIDTGIQWVGRDGEGRMATPSGYSEVGWYMEGTKPGMPGSAVIAGHLDSPNGPAVFYRLGELQPGDEIVVTTHGEVELRFVVERLERYPADAAPLERIFGPAAEARLNLITCDGAFDRGARMYLDRLVVFTKLARG